MAKAKIQIALVVNAKGEWSCAGWKNGGKEEMMDIAIDGLEQGPMEKRYWLVTEVDIPADSETVEPNVSVAL